MEKKLYNPPLYMIATLMDLRGFKLLGERVFILFFHDIYTNKNPFSFQSVQINRYLPVFLFYSSIKDSSSPGFDSIISL
jgi:hypothetical protein